MSAVRRLILASLLLAPLLPAPGPAGAEDAGIAGAVNLDVSGTPPGGGTSLLEVGRTIVRDEHIVSDAQGLAQLLFLDQTTLTVGPNSDIVIDEFVYDPASKDGHLLMEASVGVFRLIGGETAASGGITVGTPFATMGIRGSNVVIEISPNGRTRVTCNYCEAVEIQLLSDPDNLVTIFGTDRFRTIEIGPDGFSAPFQLTPEEIALLQELLTSRPGQTGGIATIPTEPDVGQNVTGANNSGNPPGSNNPGNPPLVQQGYNDQNIPNPQEQTEGGQNQNEQDALGQGEGGGDGPSTLFFTGGSFISPTGGGEGGLGLLAAGDDGWSGDLEDPEHTQAIVQAQLVGSSLVLTLEGGDVFTLPWRSGSFDFAGVGGSPGGALTGSGFVSPNGEFFSYTVQEAGGGIDFLFGGQALETYENFQEFMAWDLQPDALNSDIPFMSSAVAGFAPEDVSVSPLYFVSNQANGGTYLGTYGVAALAIEGTGPSQRTVLMVAALEGEIPGEGVVPSLRGQARGFYSEPLGGPDGVAANTIDVNYGNVATVEDGNEDTFFGGQDGVYFVLGSGKWWIGDNDDVMQQFGTNGGGGPDYEPLHVARPSPEPLPADFGEDTEGFYHSGYAAGAADLNNGQGYVGLYGTLEMALNTEASNFAILYMDTRETGEISSPFVEAEVGFGGGLFVDRSRIMLQEDYGYLDEDEAETLGAFVSYELVRLPGDVLPGGATACTCAFMEWGFWAADLYVDGDTNVLATVPLGTWMAGEQIDSEDLPFNGTASYEGHAVANILNTQDGLTSSYVAAGALSMEVDFGSQDISGSITGLDGRDYSFGAEYYNWAGANYQAFGQSSDGEIDIGLNGGFFAGPESAVQGVGGNFTLQPNELSDLDYVGTGTYMGEQVPQ